MGVWKRKPVKLIDEKPLNLDRNAKKKAKRYEKIVNEKLFNQEGVLGRKLTLYKWSLERYQILSKALKNTVENPRNRNFGWLSW